MSYRQVLVLALLSQIALVYSRVIFRRSPGSLEGLDAFRGALEGRLMSRESVKRDIQTQGMALLEFCFRKPFHPRCRQPEKPDYTVEVINN